MNAKLEIMGSLVIAMAFTNAVSGSGQLFVTYGLPGVLPELAPGCHRWFSRMRREGIAVPGLKSVNLYNAAHVNGGFAGSFDGGDRVGAVGAWPFGEGFTIIACR